MKNIFYLALICTFSFLALTPQLSLATDSIYISCLSNPEEQVKADMVSSCVEKLIFIGADLVQKTQDGDKINAEYAEIVERDLNWILQDNQRSSSQYLTLDQVHRIEELLR